METIHILWNITSLDIDIQLLVSYSHFNWLGMNHFSKLYRPATCGSKRIAAANVRFWDCPLAQHLLGFPKVYCSSIIYHVVI